MELLQAENSSVLWNVMRASLLKSALSEIEEASSEIEEASSEIEETSAFSKAGLLRNHGPISDIEEAPVFFSLVSTYHMHTYFCENHG